MEEKEGKRIVGVHHLGAEKSGATRLSQARPEARLWLRDHLGRQAWNAERWEEWGEGQIEGKTIGRQERERERKREWVRERQKKAPKGLVETKVDVRASSSSVELWIGESHRMALSKKREREREGGGINEGALACYIPAGREFSNMATRVNVGPRPIVQHAYTFDLTNYKISSSLLPAILVLLCFAFIICSERFPLITCSFPPNACSVTRLYRH